MSIEKEIFHRVLATPQGSAAEKIAVILFDAGFECWWVGGTPRDMLLGKMPKDIDMAVSATPAEMQKLFKKTDATDEALGSIVVSLDGFLFELTTFREDNDLTNGRKPESVRFVTKEKDALRRDATINAMYFDPLTETVFDPCGGLQDIKEKLVRFIGDPVTRIHQDALRILRMVRLRATIDGQYDPATYKALRSEAEKTLTLSGMRILEELEKILASDHPEIALEDLFELGVLHHILPELADCKGVAQPAEYHHEGDVWNHLLRCTTKFTEDHHADVRLAALFHDIGKVQTYSVEERIRFDHHAEVSAKTAADVLKRFHVPTERIRKIEWLISHHMMMGAFETLSDARKAHWYFHPWFRELLEVFFLDAAGTEPTDLDLYDSIVNDYNEFLNSHPRPQKPLLNGKEIMDLLQLTPGEAVGEVIQALQEAQIQENIRTKKEAKEFVQNFKHVAKTE